MNMFKEWLDILMFKKKPAELMGTSLGEGLKSIAIAGAIYGLFAGIMQYMLLSMGSQALNGLGATGADMGLAATLGPAAVVASIVFGAIGAVIGILIGGIILHILCMIVGGKGNLSEYIGVLAKIEAAFMGLVMPVLAIIGILGLLGGMAVFLGVSAFTGLIGFIAYIWAIVLIVMATKVVQQLTTGRAVIAVVIIPLAIVLILVALMGMALLSMFMGAASVTGGLPGY